MSDRLLDTIDIDCPSCNKEISISVDEINTSIQCPSCGETLNLKDDGILDALDDVENQLDNLFS